MKRNADIGLFTTPSNSDPWQSVKHLMIDNAIRGNLILLIVGSVSDVMQRLGKITDIVRTKGHVVFSVFSRLGRCAVFSGRGNDRSKKMALRIMGHVVATCLIYDIFSGDDGGRRVVDIVVPFFDVTRFDLGYVGTRGIEPFFIRGGFGDSDVGFIVPCPS